MSETETVNRADWIRRMLGMAIPLDGMGPLQAGPPKGDVDAPNGPRQAASKGKSAPKKVKLPDKVTFKKENITIERKSGGVIEYTAPPPPIRELNFAGGGGKGTALFGAVEALQDGTMDDVKQINGASVGAITAALLATGITVDELQPIVDNTGAKADTVSKITDGTMGGRKKLLWNAIRNVGSPLTGEGVRDVVAGNMDEMLRKCIQEYQADYTQKNNGTRDKVVDAILKRMDPKLGPTFQDMSDLSKIIPTIKEISVTGTYTEELDLSAIKGESQKDPAKNKTKQLDSKQKNDSGRLCIFDVGNHYKGKSDKQRFVPLPGVKEHDHKAFYKAIKSEMPLVNKKVAANG